MALLLVENFYQYPAFRKTAIVLLNAIFEGPKGLNFQIKLIIIHLFSRRGKY